MLKGILCFSCILFSTTNNLLLFEIIRIFTYNSNFYLKCSYTYVAASSQQLMLVRGQNRTSRQPKSPDEKVVHYFHMKSFSTSHPSSCLLKKASPDFLLQPLSKPLHLSPNLAYIRFSLNLYSKVTTNHISLNTLNTLYSCTMDLNWTHRCSMVMIGDTLPSSLEVLA